jgi:hypothetical protein
MKSKVKYNKTDRKRISIIKLMIVTLSLVLVCNMFMPMFTRAEGTENPAQNQNQDPKPDPDKKPDPEPKPDPTPEPPKPEPEPTPEPEPRAMPAPEPAAPAEPAAKPVPRIMVSSFATDPAQVKAGSEFLLVIKLKNTSTSTAVRNMMVMLETTSEGDEKTAAPAFLPSSGSNSIYVDRIGAGAEKDISIRLNAKGDLLQKPYSIDVKMKYEDGEANQFESASSLSIPVKQDARFEFS